MAIRKNTDPQPPAIVSRFVVAQDSFNPEEIKEQLRVQKAIRLAIFTAATEINVFLEEGREKSLALTHLEDALMWAGKSIFKEKNSNV